MASRLKPTRVLALLIALVGAALVLANAGTALVIEEPLRDPDAIVVLASHEWERLPAAAALARQAPNARVLLTVPKVVTRWNCYDCEHRAAWLVRAGVTADRIHMLDIPESDTYGEALTCRSYVTRTGVDRLLIVTSPYHARRALSVFRTILSGTPVRVGIATAKRWSPAQPARWWSAPYDRWYVGYEWAAMMFYVLRHGVIPTFAGS